MQNSDFLTLYLIRHGETVWNQELRFQGHGDSPLTATGRVQAEALGRRMQAMQFEEMYASDLGRARETAGIIASFTGHEIQCDDRLRERHYGVMEGLTENDINTRCPEVLAKLRNLNPDYQIPEGESHRQHYQRNIDFLEDLAAHKTGKKIVAVAHGGVLDSCFRYVCGLSLDQPRCFMAANAGFCELEWGYFYGARRWVINVWGDVSHLGH